MISLDELAAGAEFVVISTEDLASLLCRISAVQTRIAVYLQNATGRSRDDDQLLDVDQAAAKLAVTRQWLYRRTAKLPFVVRLDGKLRFSSVGIELFIAARRGK